MYISWEPNVMKYNPNRELQLLYNIEGELLSMFLDTLTLLEKIYILKPTRLT